MESSDNFPISEISLPEPSMLTGKSNMPSQFTALLNGAQQKRREADGKWDTLVEMLINEFSKQASMIARMKMQGQIDSPVAEELLKHIPDQAAGGYMTDLREAELERQDLNQLMSVEMQLSPVGKLRSSLYQTGQMMPNLNQSHQTSHVTPQMSITQNLESNGPESETDDDKLEESKSIQKFDDKLGSSNKQELKILSQSQSKSNKSSIEGSGDFEESKSQSSSQGSQSFEGDDSTQFDQIVRVNEDTEQTPTDDLSYEQIQTSITSSKIEKVSILQPPTETETGKDEIVTNFKKQKDQCDDEDKIPDNDDLMRYNQEMRKDKRKLSLSNYDQNQKQMEKEVSFTPKNRDNSNKSNQKQRLIVYDENPSREPPLTSKPRSSYRQQYEEQKQAQNQFKNTNAKQESKSARTSEFKIQIQATEDSQLISSSHSSISIDAEIQLSKAKKPLGLQPLRLSQVLGKPINGQAMLGSTMNSGTKNMALQSSQLNPFSNPLFMNSNGPISSRTDHRKIVGGLLFPSQDKFGTPSLLGGPINARRNTIQAQSNFDAQSNQDEFNQKAFGQLAITSNVSLTESKLILALKKQLDMAKELLEKEHTIKLRLIEGARNLKQQLTVALKENSKVRNSLNQVQSESGNQAVSPFVQVNDNAQQEQENYYQAEILSPLINIRMKVSSATQTEEATDSQLHRQVSSGGTTIIDADSGGCSFTPEKLNLSKSAEQMLKCDAQAQTEEDLAYQQENQYDHQKVEIEIQKIIENHEIETARMRGNVDFWKEKVDTLIKSQKEMLESKTKLHLQLEENDQQLQDKLQQNKKLVEEIEILQQKVTKQRYLKPQISMQQNQFGSVEEFTPHSRGLTSTAQSADKNSIGNGLISLSKAKKNNLNQGKSTMKFKSGYHHPKTLRQPQQKFENVQLDIVDNDQVDENGSFNDTSVVIEIQDKSNAGSFGVRKSTGLGTKVKTQIPEHSSISKMTYTEMANKYENQNNQSPAKQAAKRAVIKKGQNTQNIGGGGSNNKYGVPTPNSINTNTNYGQRNNISLATNDRFLSPEPIQPNSATTRQGKYPANTLLKPVLFGQKAQGKPSLKLRNSSEKNTPNISANNGKSNNTSANAANHQKKNSYTKYGSVRTPNETLRQPQSQKQLQLYDDTNTTLTSQQKQSKKPSGLPQAGRPQLVNNKKKQSISGNNDSTQLFGVGATSSKDLTPSGQNQSSTNDQQIQLQHSSSSYQATQAKYAPLDKPLTTQDKFSLFTQKHVKQAKKQESDQKAQRDMMVQLIRDRLLQKNTNPTPSVNVSTMSINQSRADIQHQKQLKRRNMSQLDSGENQLVQNAGTNYLLQTGRNLTPEDRTLMNHTMIDQSMDNNLNLLIQEMNEEDQQQTIVNENPSHNNQYIYDTGGCSGATDSINFRPQQQQHQDSRFQDSNTPEGTSQYSHNNTTTNTIATNPQLATGNHELSQNMLMTRTGQYGAAAIQQNSSLGRTQELIQRKTAGSAYSKRANEAVVYQPLNGLSSKRSSNAGQTAGNHSARAKFITQTQSQQAVLMRNTQAIPSVEASITSSQNQQAIPGRILSLSSQQNQSITNSNSKTNGVVNSSTLSHLQFQSRLRAPSKNQVTQQNERFPTPLEQRQMKKRLSTEESELQPSDSDARLKRYF